MKDKNSIIRTINSKNFNFVDSNGSSLEYRLFPCFADYFSFEFRFQKLSILGYNN